MTDEDDTIRKAMSLLGSRSTEKKRAAVRRNGFQPGQPQKPVSEETKAKMRAAQQARRERERKQNGQL